MTDLEDIEALSVSLVEGLRSRGRTVATAESCTGGWVAKAITDVNGSSHCFGYGLVTYSNGAKESMLGVEPATLVEHGAVSEKTVQEMVSGAMALSGADYAVAVSGIAGPEGGTDDKPVGTVWFAWASRAGNDTEIVARKYLFSGDRAAIRSRTVLIALRGLMERLK